MDADDSDAVAAGAIESITTADVGGRETIQPIAAAVADRQGRNRAMAAAGRLVEAVGPNETVVVLTGFPIPPTMTPETDGPPGAVSLARAIDGGLDGNVVIACDPGAVEACTATATAGGLSVQDRETALESARTVAVEAYPTDPGAAASYAAGLADLDPAAVVAVEKVGPNREGVYHNMAGYDVSEAAAKVGTLYDAVDDDVLTVAVGDAGNEVGMGVVESTVREEIRYGDACQCACGAGIACALDADVLVPAAVSNWGAHGIVAAASVLLDEPLLHSPAQERRMLVQGSLAGAIDGIGGGTTGWCDGLPTEAHEATVRLLGQVPRSSVHDRGGGELGR
jgi:hypothetical protein